MRITPSSVWIWVCSSTRCAAGDAAPIQISDEQRTALGHNLVQCLASGLIEVSAAPDRFVTTISEKPLASRMARFEATRSKKVTNRTHELIELDDAARNLLPYLDGLHDRQALLRELVEAIDRGDVSILVDGLPVAKGAAVADTLESTLDLSLRHLARVACLVA